MSKSWLTLRLPFGGLISQTKESQSWSGLIASRSGPKEKKHLSRSCALLPKRANQAKLLGRSSIFLMSRQARMNNGWRLMPCSIIAIEPRCCLGSKAKSLNDETNIRAIIFYRIVLRTFCRKRAGALKHSTCYRRPISVRRTRRLHCGLWLRKRRGSESLPLRASTQKSSSTSSRQTIRNHCSNSWLKNSRIQEFKNSRIQEPRGSRRGTHRSILEYLST